MAAEPTPEVLAALRAAAIATNVPLSLLWGVAFAESGFDPSKVGPQVKTGERALGLMQLMPKTAAANGVSDPMDATQSALGGAKMLAKLGRALKWDVHAMLAAYVWGPTNYARAAASSQAGVGVQVPGEVSTYVRRALAARDVFRNKADRPAGTIMVALNRAIENLAARNPNWAPATQTRNAWRPFYAARSADPDSLAVLNPTLKTHARSYAIAYERAPLTDESTPRPELVAPNLWLRVAKTVDRVKDAAGDAALGIGSGVFLVALFLLTVSADRRR